MTHPLFKFQEIASGRRVPIQHALWWISMTAEREQTENELTRRTIGRSRPSVTFIAVNASHDFVHA